MNNLMCNTVKPALTNHSKIDKTKVLKTNGSLMKVESILQYFWPEFSLMKVESIADCNTFDLH